MKLSFRSRNLGRARGGIIEVRGELEEASGWRRYHEVRRPLRASSVWDHSCSPPIHAFLSRPASLRSCSLQASWHRFSSHRSLEESSYRASRKTLKAAEVRGRPRKAAEGCGRLRILQALKSMKINTNPWKSMKIIKTTSQSPNNSLKV